MTLRDRQPAAWPLTLAAAANGKPKTERLYGAVTLSGADLNATFPLGGEFSGECSTHGCRLGSDGRGDLTRHGRPARRAALAGRRGRELGAGSHHSIIWIRSHFGCNLVSRALGSCMAST